MSPLRRLADQLAELAAQAERGEPPDTFVLRVLARRIAEQAKSLEAEKADGS